MPTATGRDERADLSGLKALIGWDDGAFYEVKNRDQGGRAFGSKTYSTLMHARTEHGGPLHALAESGRMYTLQCNTRSVHQKTVNLRLWKCGPIFRQVLNTAENMLQLELQGSALELGKAVSPTHEVDKETVASLFLSLIMASYNLLIFCKTFGSQARACWCADVDDRDYKEEKVKYVKYNKKGQDLLLHCGANICHSCHFFRFARAACSGEDRHGVYLLRLWVDFEVESVRRLRSTSVKTWDLLCGVRRVDDSSLFLRVCQTTVCCCVCI